MSAKLKSIFQELADALKGNVSDSEKSTLIQQLMAEDEALSKFKETGTDSSQGGTSLADVQERATSRFGILSLIARLESIKEPVDVNITASVAISTTILNSSIAITGAVGIIGTVTIDGTVSISGTVTIAGDVSISSGTVTFTNTTIAVTGSVVIASGTVTFTNTTIGITGAVTITSGTVNANITNSSITIAGAVSITSGIINVQTSGGTNIVLDLLTQGAYIPRQTTLANPNAVPTDFVAINSPNLRGKFFSRGCRGFIDKVYLYMQNTDTSIHNVYMYLAAYPGQGAMYSLTAAVGVGWSSWVPITLGKMWSYDSLFIWFYSDHASLTAGVDNSGTPDCFYSNDSGLTWAFTNNRYYFKVDVSGQTVSDLPVSGTVNNIEIPNAVSARQEIDLAVPATSELLDTIQAGTGFLLCAYFRCMTTERATNLKPRIYCDGVSILPFDRTLFQWHDYYVTVSSPELAVGVWDTVNQIYTVIVTARFPFKRSIQVGFYNQHASNAETGSVAYSWEKIG